MTSPADALRPFIEWCDVPLTETRDAHVLRFYLIGTADPAESLYYYGSLAFRRSPQRRFDGTAVAAVDPRAESFPRLPDFEEWFVRVSIALSPGGGGVGVVVTFCHWNNDTFSAGTVLREIEADQVRVGGSGTLAVVLAGQPWQLRLARSTVKGF
jgi:hypothetical protein